MNSENRQQLKASPLKELFMAVGLVAIIAPFFLSLIAPDPSPTVKILLIVLGLLLAFGGMLALFYGLSYTSRGKGSARTKPAHPSWQRPPESTDEPVFDLSKNAAGSSAGVRTPWQHDMTPRRWTIMPERLWILPELEWRPLPITLGLGSLAILMVTGPWLIDYLTDLNAAEWIGLFRMVQLVLLAGGIVLLWFAAPRVVTELPTAEQREQLANDR
jgi:hypothetical protein